MRHKTKLKLETAAGGRQITKRQWRAVKRAYVEQPKNEKDIKAAVRDGLSR